MAMNTTDRERGTLLRNTSWQVYSELRLCPDNDHVRMTFDRGDLELMSPSKPHERLGYLIGRCIDTWTLARHIAMQGCRSTTFRREDLQRGLEPDNCYYIAHEAVVREREEVDLTIDPPPDLVIEVDIRSHSIDRLSIYAALGVPEVWRWEDDKLYVYVLSSTGDFSLVADSQSLPGFPCDRMVDLLLKRSKCDETTLIREFQKLCQT
jgi:Uma2 family endonuclease